MNISTTTPAQDRDTVTLVVTEIIQDTLCITSDDGQKVYRQIAAAFREGKKVILSFKNGQDLTGAFLSDAIAQLYASFPEEQIEDQSHRSG